MSPVLRGATLRLDRLEAALLGGGDPRLHLPQSLVEPELDAVRREAVDKQDLAHLGVARVHAGQARRKLLTTRER